MAEKGLEGVVVADTKLSYVDGQKGQLTYRGYDINDLAEHCSFEEVAYLMWYGKLPTRLQCDELTRQLATHRFTPDEAETLLEQFPRSAPPMSVLRTALSVLGMLDARAESDVSETNQDMAIELTAQSASILANFHRLRTAGRLAPSEPRLSHAANFLYKMSGRLPDELSTRVFDTCLVLHIDHDFNASTFTARVIASTLSDIYSAVTGAIGALRGPLHGGANTRVMMMLEEIGEPSRAADYVKNLLVQKKRIMGFGHRVYKTADPRATILRKWCQRLGEHLGQTKWAGMQAIIEEVMLKEKGLHCNVDFYSAPVYHMLGIPKDLFTPIFAISRIVGWTAHILEQYADNRLIRPAVNYVGPKALEFVPMDKR